MKTPDEIKKGLEKCSDSPLCIECPYYPDADCQQLNFEALAYIQWLEMELEQVKRERDAAVYDLRNCSLHVCMTCNNSTGLNECEVFGKRELPEGEFIGLCGQYEWRGLCKENGGVKNE